MSGSLSAEPMTTPPSTRTGCPLIVTPLKKPSSFLAFFFLEKSRSL